VLSMTGSTVPVRDPLSALGSCPELKGPAALYRRWVTAGATADERGDEVGDVVQAKVARPTLCTRQRKALCLMPRSR
jgi:hypothetical protein